jgi:hypothetical protein
VQILSIGANREHVKAALDLVKERYAVAVRGEPRTREQRASLQQGSIRPVCSIKQLETEAVTNVGIQEALAVSRDVRVAILAGAGSQRFRRASAGAYAP